MRDFLRRWLGLEEDCRRAEAVARGLVEPLWQKVADSEKYVIVMDRAATALERVHEDLCVNLNMIGEHLANLQASQAELHHTAIVETPICCPQNPDHTGQLVVTVLEEVDSKTFERKVVGAGMYCPRCQKSYYYEHGRKWVVEGTTVEVDQGMPTDTPRGVHREPEVKQRPLRFRG